MYCFYFILFYFHSFGVPFLLKRGMIIALFLKVRWVEFLWVLGTYDQFKCNELI